MGIFHGAILIVGWRISYDKLKAHLQKNNFQGCGEHTLTTDDYDICWTCVEDLCEIERNLSIERSDPYFDCKPKHRHYYLTLAKVANQELSLDEFIWKAQNHVEWDQPRIRDLAVELGAEDSCPSVFAVPNIT